MAKVLVTDDVHEMMIANLKRNEYEVDYRPGISLKEVHNIIHEYTGMIINSKIIAHEDLLSKAKKLKFIGRLGSGLEIIDLHYAKAKGINVHSAPEGNRNAVAEHALGMLLSIANNLVKGNREVKSFHWDREGNRGFELEGKRVGIIGFGHTGSSFAKKLTGFNLEVLAYDKYKSNFASDLSFVKECTLEQVLEECEIISLHLPLTSETRYFVNEDFMRRWKHPLVLINTSRGNVINTKVLIQALDTGKLQGAALDVFENEKPNKYSDDEAKMYRKLFDFPNVLVSPHVAGWTVESKRKIAETLIEKIFGVV